MDLISLVRQRNSFPALFLILCYFVIFLVPRIGGNLRLEDILMPLIIVLPFFLSISKKIFFLILPYLLLILYELLVLSFYFSNGSMPLDSFLLIGKFFQYLFLYLLTLVILEKDSGKFLFTKFFKLMIFIGMIWGFLALTIFDRPGYYGISWINELSPSLSGLVFFSLTVIATTLYLQGLLKPFYGITAITLLIFLIFSVGSPSAFVEVCIFIFLLSFLRLIISYKFIIFFSSLLATFLFFQLDFVSIETALYNNEIPIEAVQMSVSRFAALLSLIDSIEGSRGYSWDLLISKFWDGNIFFGCGRGCSHLEGEYFSTAISGDSQYLVNLVEIGMIGSILFILAVISPSFAIKGDLRIIWFPFLISYLIWGINAEVWLVSKGAQMFWLIAAYLISFSSIKQRYN